MATRASRIALAGSNISSTGEVDADLLDNTDSAAFLSLDGSGFLGIGTASPLSLIMAESTGGNLTSGNAIKSSTMKGLTLNAQEGAAHLNSLGVWFGSNGGHWSGIAGGRSNTSTWGTDLRFYTHEDNTADLTYSRQRMIISSEGNVGIGATNTLGTNNKLTLYHGDGTSYGALSLQSNHTSTGNSNGSWLGIDNTSAMGLYVWNYESAPLRFGTSAVDRMHIMAGGNVGIGTITPNEKLQVAGNINAYDPSGIDSAIFASTGSGSTPISIRSSGITHFNGGNVGINTSSPGETLSVNGSVSGSSYRILSGPTISVSTTPQNTKVKGPSGTDVGISLYNSANTWSAQLYADGNNSYGFLNGEWGGWDLKKTVAASGGNLYMNNSVAYYLNANGTSKTYKHLIGGVSNTAGGAVFKVGSADNNGELSLNSVVGGSDIVSYNRTTGAYHPLTTYASLFKVHSGSAQTFSIENTGHIKTQYGNTGGYAQTSGSGGIAIVNDTGGAGCSLISVVNSARGWSNFYVNRIHTSGQDTRFMQFIVNGSGACGYVRLASASTMTYGTSSDYRLKENVVYDWDATTRLKQLKPARFNFILDGPGVTQDGFMAHEVSDIVPLAVQGTKDAMKEEDYEATPAVYDDNGVETAAAVMGTRTAIDGQGIDHSMLVPLLVKTIQELEARLTAAGI